MAEYFGNLFTDAHAPPEGERFDPILSHNNLVIERIVSSATIISQEYVQLQDEWVVLLQGEALLDVAGEVLTLHAGDYLFLPAGTPHSIVRTSAGATWLAVHLYPQQAPTAPTPSHTGSQADPGHP